MRKKLWKLIEHGLEGLVMGGLSSLVASLVSHGIIGLACFFSLLIGAGTGFILGIIIGLILHGYD